MISKSCKYAIRATLFVASNINEGIKLSVKDIAKEINAPEAFTAKILQSLTKHKIVTSLKGPNGGFYSEEQHLKLSLINIVNAIDGLSFFHECGLGLKQCSDKHPCPLHNDYKGARDKMLKVFNKTTIGQLSKTVKKGNSFVNNL
jgi:Rrf2 family protein